MWGTLAIIGRSAERSWKGAFRLETILKRSRPKVRSLHLCGSLVYFRNVPILMG